MYVCARANDWTNEKKETMAQRRMPATIGVNANNILTSDGEAEMEDRGGKDGKSRNDATIASFSPATTTTTNSKIWSMEQEDADDDDDDNEKTAMIDIQNDSEEIQKLKRRQQRRYEKWKGSFFAVGLTEATWMDERTRHIYSTNNYRDPASYLPPDETGCLCCSALICPLFGARRVGNMSVLKQSVEWVDSSAATATTTAEEMDPEEQRRQQHTEEQPEDRPPRRVARPRLEIVVGPYWPMLCFVTYPLILGVSAWTLYAGLLHNTAKTTKRRPSTSSSSSTTTPIVIWFVWIVLTISLITALAFTGLRDPGILPRTRGRHPPDASWRWSDAADSYRPRNAWFDSDTAVLVDGFDHTYVRTNGTAYIHDRKRAR